jgi:hypothetical protein
MVLKAAKVRGRLLKKSHLDDGSDESCWKMLLKGRSPTLLLTSLERASCVPSRFWNFSKAETALGKLESWLLQFLLANDNFKGQAEIELSFAIAQGVRQLRNQFERWYEAFETLVDGLELEFSSDKAKARSLQNSISMIKVEFSCYRMALVEFCPVSDSELTTSNKDGLRSILEEIKAIIHRESLNTNPALRGFSCENGMVMYLSYIAFKAGNPRARERALSLLEGRTRREDCGTHNYGVHWEEYNEA